MNYDTNGSRGQTPGTDETDMNFRRLLPEIRCQPRLSPVYGASVFPPQFSSLKLKVIFVL